MYIDVCIKRCGRLLLLFYVFPLFLLSIARLHTFLQATNCRFFLLNFSFNYFLSSDFSSYTFIFCFFYLLSKNTHIKKIFLIALFMNFLYIFFFNNFLASFFPFNLSTLNLHLLNSFFLLF